MDDGVGDWVFDGEVGKQPRIRYGILGVLCACNVMASLDEPCHDVEIEVLLSEVGLHC